MSIQRIVQQWLPGDLACLVNEYASHLPFPSVGLGIETKWAFFDAERHRLFWAQMHQHPLPMHDFRVLVTMGQMLHVNMRQLMNRIVDRLFLDYYPVIPHMIPERIPAYSRISLGEHEASWLSQRQRSLVCSALQFYVDHIRAYIRPVPLDPAAYTDEQMRRFLSQAGIDGLVEVGDETSSSLIIPGMRYGGIGKICAAFVPGEPELIGSMFYDSDNTRHMRFRFHGRVYEERSCRHPGYFTWLWDETHTRWCGGGYGPDSKYKLSLMPARPTSVRCQTKRKRG